jgi:hypothetical protein
MGGYPWNPLADWNFCGAEVFFSAREEAIRDNDLLL